MKKIKRIKRIKRMKKIKRIKIMGYPAGLMFAAQRWTGKPQTFQPAKTSGELNDIGHFSEEVF